VKKIFEFIFILVLLTMLTGCAPTLHDAVNNDDLEKVRALLKEGADVNARDHWGTALHAAALHNRRNDIIRILLDAGADVNSKDYWGMLPLQWAAFNGSIESAKLLLDKGADVNATDNHGKTPLVSAAHGKHTEMIKFLISKGADVDIAILTVEGLAVKYPKEWVIEAKLLAKYAQKQEVGRTAPLISIANNEAQLSPVIKSDVDELPAIKVKHNKHAYAIVIGIENYRQKLPKADFATQDARLVAGYLIKTMGYPEENVVMLLNDRASKSDFEKYFEKWLGNNVEKGSTVFVYYSGHGAPNTKTGDAYLVPYDGDPTFIAETGYSIARLYESLGKLKAKEITVVLDSCFSGAGGRSVLAKGAKPLVMTINMPTMRKNISVMTASSGDQISSAYEEQGHGLFTYFLLKGIKDEDVVRQDGSIKMADLFGYIKPQVERIARKQFNNKQTPQLIGVKKN
jgi:hypothetical protein